VLAQFNRLPVTHIATDTPHRSSSAAAVAPPRPLFHPTSAQPPAPTTPRLYQVVIYLLELARDASLVSRARSDTPRAAALFPGRASKDDGDA
jgi:hypothetical protein